MSPARALRRISLVGLSVLALAVPIAVTVMLNDISDSIRPVRDQHTTSVAPLPSSESARYLAFAATAQPGILLLSYHDVRPTTEESTNPDDEDIYTVTPEQFAQHLQMLRTAGFESISTDTLVRAREDPAILPERPVMITFDDGTSGLWRYADPLLEQYGFRGVAFVITGSLDTHYPYYLTWGEATALQETGRWDIESHTHAGHGRIPAGGGERAPFLINLMQRPDGGMETLQAATARVAADTDQAISQLTTRRLPRPRLFAYPFSADSTPTNSPDLAAASREILAQRYALLMINELPPRWTSARDIATGLLPRIEVFKQTNTRALFDMIVGAAPADASSPAR